MLTAQPPRHLYVDSIVTHASMPSARMSKMIVPVFSTSHRRFTTTANTPATTLTATPAPTHTHPNATWYPKSLPHHCPPRPSRAGVSPRRRPRSRGSSTRARAASTRTRRTTTAPSPSATRAGWRPRSSRRCEGTRCARRRSRNYVAATTRYAHISITVLPQQKAHHLVRTTRSLPRCNTTTTSINTVTKLSLRNFPIVDAALTMYCRRLGRYFRSDLSYSCHSVLATVHHEGRYALLRVRIESSCIHIPIKSSGIQVHSKPIFLFPAVRSLPPSDKFIDVRQACSRSEANNERR